MANEQNLRPCEHKFTEEEAKKGQRASAEARRQKRDLRRALEVLLEKDYVQKDGSSISGAEAISVRLFQQAMKGNIRAYTTVRETVGQDPVQKIEVSQTDPAVVSEVEKLVYSDDDSE